MWRGCRYVIIEDQGGTISIRLYFVDTHGVSRAEKPLKPFDAGGGFGNAKGGKNHNFMHVFLPYIYIYGLHIR